MEHEMLRVGFIGYGTIGQEVARLIETHAATEIHLVGALVQHPSRPRPAGPRLVTTSTELLAERQEVVVEVAGHAGLREHGPACLRAGIDLLLVSAGALAEPATMQEVQAAAHQGGAKAHVLSGAVGALDTLAAAASVGGITRLTHTIRRPPQAFLTPEEASRVTTVQEIFRGSARQAVGRFPRLLNVAAAVALASNSLDQAEVILLVDPQVQGSQHEIRAEGAFGSLRCEVENGAHHEGSPLGSRLVALSVFRALLSRRAFLVIG